MQFQFQYKPTLPYAEIHFLIVGIRNRIADFIGIIMPKF